MVEDLCEVIDCGLISSSHTTLGDECSELMPLSSMLNIRSGLSCRLFWVKMLDNSLKYLSMFSFDVYLALQVESFWGLTSLRLGHLDMKP